MTTYELLPDVRDVLARCALQANQLRLPEQLDRALYVRVNKALELMGGQWNRKLKAHVFSDSADAAVQDAIATGTVFDFRKHFQFFETPEPLADELVYRGVSGTPVGIRVLEPSAGRGRIVHALRAQGVEPDACELYAPHRQHLQTLGVRVVGQDFLKLQLGRNEDISFATPPAEGYDLIVANPPFSRGQDMQHVLHMYRCLKVGGRLLSVMCVGWRFREDVAARRFRAFAELCAAEWIELPEDTFAESGTHVRCGVIDLTKRALRARGAKP